ncbi:hypothetical protein GCM10010358_45190 [Streptomyces minutiscleroticus]|uniref:Uncharacterized protein n=1 Tax=Streptomyces minutiscleroticus TaxID=68238 RepID=A0A918NPN5_9ACTN|nr:hypothetical protein GCM10010358_45190 [Streptomyces minutiscleroticus]
MFSGEPTTVFSGEFTTVFPEEFTTVFPEEFTTVFSGEFTTVSSTWASGPWSTRRSVASPVEPVGESTVVVALLPEVPVAVTGAFTPVGVFPVTGVVAAVGLSTVTGVFTVRGVSTVTGVPKPSRVRRIWSASTWAAGPLPAGTTRTSGNCDRLPYRLSRAPISAMPGARSPRRAARSRSACSRTSAEPLWTCCHRAFSAAVTGSGPGEYGGGSWVVYGGGSCA